MIRRSRISVRLLPFMTVLVMLALAPAALAQDDEDEEPAKVSVVNRGMVVNNIQFDSVGLRQHRVMRTPASPATSSTRS